MKGRRRSFGRRRKIEYRGLVKHTIFGRLTQMCVGFHRPIACQGSRLGGLLVLLWLDKVGLGIVDPVIWPALISLIQQYHSDVVSNSSF